MNKRGSLLPAALFASAICTSAMSVNAGAVSVAHNYDHVSITTQLIEVQKGTFDGRDYLTINIGGVTVGPSSCRSNVLRIDSSGDTELSEQLKQIETIALSAMLREETVVIVVPLDAGQCVEGKPTFTDLHLSSNKT